MRIPGARTLLGRDPETRTPDAVHDGRADGTGMDVWILPLVPVMVSVLEGP